MSAADQDLVQRMFSDCDASSDASIIFHDASTGIPGANLGCEDDEDVDILIDMASQMANAKG